VQVVGRGLESLVAAIAIQVVASGKASGIGLLELTLGVAVNPDS